MRVLVVIAGLAAAMEAHASDQPVASDNGGDPAGILESVWIDAVLSADSHRMSSLGLGAALNGDRAESRRRDLLLEEPMSAQLDYVRDPFDPHFARVARLSLLRSIPMEAGRPLNVIGTLGFARGARLAPGVRMRNLNFARAAISVPLSNTLRVNFRANYMSGSGIRSRFFGNGYEMRDPAAVAIAASLDYSRGNWRAGPFIQWARAGDDVVDVAGAGASRRLTNRMTAYVAYYGYQFSQTAALMPAASTSGNAVIVGFDYRL